MQRGQVTAKSGDICCRVSTRVIIAMFSCVLGCNCLGSSDDRRKVESLPQSQFSLMKDFKFVATEFPGRVSELLRAGLRLCRPCFRSIGTLERLKKDVGGKEEKLRSMTRRAGVEQLISISSASYM